MKQLLAKPGEQLNIKILDEDIVENDSEVISESEEEEESV